MKGKARNLAIHILSFAKHIFICPHHIVHELQKQLTEIKTVMTNLRRNESCRTKKERILMDAYQLLNAGENKSCVPDYQPKNGTNNTNSNRERFVFVFK